MQCKYDIKRILEFKNEKCKSDYFSIDDDIWLIYEDFNEGDIEVKGKIVGIEEDGYLLISNTKTLRIEMYYLSNIKHLIHYIL